MRFTGYVRKEFFVLGRDLPGLGLALASPLVIVWLFSRLDLASVQFPGDFRDTSPVALVLCLSIWLASLTAAGTALYRERLSGTIERLQATPFSPGLLILSKGAALGVVGLLQSVIVWLVAKLLLADEVRRAADGPAILALTLLAMATISLGLFVATLLTSPVQVASLVTILTLSVIVLSGFFKPLDRLGAMGTFASYLPFTLGYDAVREALRGQDLGFAAPVLLVVESIGLIALSAVILRAGPASARGG